jgi:MarR family transcriptional regulator, lower aerobic nicotinate degradation pathway regulator
MNTEPSTVKKPSLTSASSQVVAKDSEPPWHRVPTAIARRFHQICVARTSEVVGQAGLTPLQYGVLIHLNTLTGRPGIEQNKLADRLNIDRNTASLLIEQLAKKGLVERRVNGADRRARLLNLTSKGEKVFARLRPIHLATNESILAPITPRERALLMDLLIRVIEGNLVRQSAAAGLRKRKSSP